MSSKPRVARKTKVAAEVQDAVPGDMLLSLSLPMPSPQQQPQLSPPLIKERKSGSSTKSKKTPPVVAIVTPGGITGSFMSEQRPLIAHLPVRSCSIKFESNNFLKSEESGPKAYEHGSGSLSYLEGIHEGTGVDSNTIMEKPHQEIAETKCKLPSHYSEKLMVLFQDSNRYNKLPTSTDIACFWCCHSFTSCPCAIPSHILDEIWYMYGNFCSPECATSYLFKERVDNHVQWERYALLNSLYAEDAEVPAGSPSGVRPSPPREVLRMFGGSMDI